MGFKPRQSHPSINMVQNNIDPSDNLGIQRFLHPQIPTKHEYKIGTTISIPTGWFFDAIIDVD